MEKVIVKINDKTLEAKIAELREWKATLEEVVDEVDKITADIKGIMNDIGETKVECGGMKISATEVTMKKIESDFVKEEFPEIYDRCTEVTKYKRFTIKVAHDVNGTK